MHEFQLESLFQHWSYFRNGCRNCSYTSICGAGPNGAVLHYGHAGAPNDGVIRDGQMMLLDMGAEYHCYTSDITCSFPANGVFTPDQTIVFNAVQQAQFAVMDALKPGVNYIDMHELSYRVILTHLAAGGILKGDVEEMMKANMGAVFMPHGLGHFLGLDTHDVGGKPEGYTVQSADGFKSLRCCRTMEAGMVLTVEPGCYFNDYTLTAALADPVQSAFIDTAVLSRFRGFGGVRLEDCIIITPTGCENMTQCPRTVEDIEAVMAGQITTVDQLFKKY
jgi:Xaa-Pro dipeptidase